MTAAAARRPRAACVILTMGDRPDDLARAVASARAQTGAPDVLVVANGAEVPDQGPDVRVVRLAENLGPAGGRNRAVAEVDADVLFFLDDDTSYPDPALVERALARFAAEPRLGILSFRVVDPQGRAPQRRHVPRLRAGDPQRSSEVTTFLEGACAIRREVFARVGGYPEEFFFDHEGTDLAWRALDAGYRIRYAGDLVVNHPALPATRHARFHHLTARNRLFLARRRLPAPLAVAYTLVWVAISLARARSPRAVADLARGFADGLRLPCGERRPMRWRTAWRMTLIGRPPLV